MTTDEMTQDFLGEVANLIRQECGPILRHESEGYDPRNVDLVLKFLFDDDFRARVQRHPRAVARSLGFCYDGDPLFEKVLSVFQNPAITRIVETFVDLIERRYPQLSRHDLIDLFRRELCPAAPVPDACVGSAK